MNLDKDSKSVAHNREREPISISRLKNEKSSNIGTKERRAPESEKGVMYDGGVGKLVTVEKGSQKEPMKLKKGPIFFSSVCHQNEKASKRHEPSTDWGEGIWSANNPIGKTIILS